MMKLTRRIEAEGMDDSKELFLWDWVSISILGVRHGLLFRQAVSELFESSAFVYVTGGKAQIQVDHEPYSVKSNALLHVGANRHITIDAEAEELEYFFVTYQADLLPAVGRELVARSLDKSPFQQTWILRTAEPVFFAEQFVAMTDAWNTAAPLSHIKLKACFYAVVYEFYSELTAGVTHPVEIDPFEYARRYLQQNYAQASSIQALAESLGITRAALHEQFKRNIGIGPQQYLMQLRLDAACRELTGSSMTIDEIAASCGLRDKTYFSRVFKQKYGVSPGIFRKQNMVSVETGPGRYGGRRYLSPQNGKDYVLIENMGRVHRYYGIPRRIVCLDYATAELCAALGAADKIVGIASAESALADCTDEYRAAIAKAPFLPGCSVELNVPSFDAVLSCRPDIVIGTGYSFNQFSGVASAEDFEEKGIHIYALKATYTLGCGFDSVHEDIRNLGKILGQEQQAETHVRLMLDKEHELDLLAGRCRSPIRVFSFDAVAAGKAITCGQSLENHMIEKAGGVNIFGHIEKQFVPVTWDEVAKANPQAIIVHSFHTQADGWQKADFLKRIREIERTDAIRNSRLFIVGIKKVFPAMDNVDTAYQLCKWLHGW